MEKEKIIEDFNKVITYSQGIENPKTIELIEECFAAKDYFINVFGDLIFEVPEEVSFELDAKEKINRVSDFCDKVERDFGEYELSCFIYEQRESFFSNRVGKNYVKKDGDVVPEGMKLMRAFRLFVDDEEKVRRIQDAASNLIQEDKITGTLCFSVHPLDFLSSSENNHNWRSCHALDGDFRAGNLSYMTDSCTFMCYLKSEEEVILPNFPPEVKWNNKKWRTLMFLNDTRDLMFAGRQYPFSSAAGITLVKDLLYKYFPVFGKWTDWTGEKIKTYNTPVENISLSSPYIGVGNKLLPMRTLIKDRDAVNPLHFNDLLKSSCYNPVYSYKITPHYSFYFGERESVSTNASGRFLIGGPVKCLRCGQAHIEMPEFMSCLNCELEYGDSESEDIERCPCCDRRFFVDDGVFVDYPGEFVCDDCADRYVRACEGCGMYFYTEDMVWDDDECTYYCTHCR